MGEAGRHNLAIAGMGSSNGGAFRSVKIEGMGRIDGDISCTDFIVNGKATVHGSINAASAEIHGTAAVQGSLQLDRLAINGKVTVGGDIKADRIQVNGMVSVQGSCETEVFAANGRLQISTLNAGHIQITLHGNSHIAEIGGEQITIRKQPGIDFAKWLKVLPLPLGNRISMQCIEGDDVYVEYTTAAVIRGVNVSIGPGCEIGLVEYKTKLIQDKASKVMKAEQV